MNPWKTFNPDLEVMEAVLGRLPDSLRGRLVVNRSATPAFGWYEQAVHQELASAAAASKAAVSEATVGMVRKFTGDTMQFFHPFPVMGPQQSDLWLGAYDARYIFAAARVTALPDDALRHVAASRDQRSLSPDVPDTARVAGLQARDFDTAVGESVNPWGTFPLATASFTAPASWLLRAVAEARSAKRSDGGPQAKTSGRVVLGADRVLAFRDATDARSIPRPQVTPTYTVTGRKTAEVDAQRWSPRKGEQLFNMKYVELAVKFFVGLYSADTDITIRWDAKSDYGPVEWLASGPGGRVLSHTERVVVMPMRHD